MVRPPPGVSSGVRVPPIASVEPARQREARGRRRWCCRCRRGAGTARRPGRGRPAEMPGPRSMTRSSTRSPRLLPVTVGGRRRASTAARWRPGWRRPARAGPGRQRPPAGRPGRRSRTARAAGPEVVQRQRDAPRRAPTGRADDRQRAGLQPAHVEQVVDQPGRAGRATRRRCQQLVAVLGATTSMSSLRRLVTAAFAEASGVRRSWPTAASSAVRIRSASASGAAAAAASLSRCRSSDHGGLGGERADEPLVLGAQRPAAQREHSVSPAGTSVSASSGR